MRPLNQDKARSQFFPQIGYTWSSDSFQFSFASNWFFAAPLLLGTVGLLLAIWRR